MWLAPASSGVAVSGLGRTRMEQLNRYAVRAEEKLNTGSDLAERVYRWLVRCFIGTGAVSSFSTIIEETKSAVSSRSECILVVAWTLNSIAVWS